MNEQAQAAALQPGLLPVCRHRHLASTRLRPCSTGCSAVSNLLSSELVCDMIKGATLYTWLAKILKRGFIGIVAIDHIDEFAPEIGGTR